MKRVAVISILVAALAAAGCTSYQSKGFTGGFTDTQLDTNVWQVAFKGNGITSRERVRDFGLLRAAELTLQNKYSYFLVMNENDYSTLHTIGNYSTTSNVNCTLVTVTA